MLIMALWDVETEIVAEPGSGIVVDGVMRIVFTRAFRWYSFGMTIPGFAAVVVDNSIGRDWRTMTVLKDGKAVCGVVKPEKSTEE